MANKFKSSLLLLFLVQLLFAQESEWYWQNPYPLPFIDKLHKTVDGRILIQHDNDEIYQINDDDTFTRLDMNLPKLNYVTGQGIFSILSDKKWIIFAPYVIYLTEDGGKSYEEFTSNLNWQYSQPQFIDEMNGIVKRVKGSTKQVVRTDDGGKTWKTILTGINPYTIEMVSKDTMFYSLYGGSQKVQRTTDGGENWEEMGICKYCNKYKKVGENLIAISDFKILISNDDGKSFDEVLKTYDENGFEQLNQFIESYDNLVIASSGKSVYKSIDRGFTWEQVSTSFPEISMIYGFLKNKKSFYSVYEAPHIGVLKHDLDVNKMESILSIPINDIKSIIRFESGILGIHSYNSLTSQHHIYTSKDNGYTWEKFIVNLPDGEKYAQYSAHLRPDSSFYLGYKNRVYYYQNFQEEYISKVEIDEIPEHPKYALRVFDNGTGIICGTASEYMYYSADEFNSYEIISFPHNIIWRMNQISNNRYWLIGRNTLKDQTGVSCLVNQGKVDSCYTYSGINRTYNLHGDDIIVSSDKKGENFRINAESGMTDFCPELKGQVRGIISKDTMIMQDHALLYLANPNTCEVLEYADIDYSSYLANTVSDINLKFTLLDNGDIFGYDSGGYMIRKTNNFLDTLLYNSNKEVEYEATTQEFHFLVYPNPTSDWLQVKDMPYGVECRIIDMTGREYMYGKQSLIYTGQYPSGTYIIQFIQDGRLIESQKIVIQ